MKQASRLLELTHQGLQRILNTRHKELRETVLANKAQQNWQVEKCADGKAALARIVGGADYDLVLVDYDLPGLNGLELVQHARKLTNHSRTPIVVLSATPVAAEARDAGADAFLQKPQDVTLVVETIGRLLQTNEQEDREA